MTRQPSGFDLDGKSYAWSDAPWNVYRSAQARPDCTEDHLRVLAAFPYRMLPGGDLLSLVQVAEETGKDIDTTVDTLAEMTVKGWMGWDQQRQGAYVRLPDGHEDAASFAESYRQALAEVDTRAELADHVTDLAMIPAAFRRAR